MKAMRIIVVSDTHGRSFLLSKIMALHPEAEVFIHLGDGGAEVPGVGAAHPGLRVYALKGNCDSAPLPDRLLITEGEKRIFAAHGHKLFVKSGTEKLTEEARKAGADIALFGHTHVAMTSYEDSLYLLNPGSLSFPREGAPSYGVIDITKAGIVTNVVKIRQDKK